MWRCLSDIRLAAVFMDAVLMCLLLNKRNLLRLTNAVLMLIRLVVLACTLYVRIILWNLSFYILVPTDIGATN